MTTCHTATDDSFAVLRAALLRALFIIARNARQVVDATRARREIDVIAREIDAFAREMCARSANARTICALEQRKCLTFVPECALMHNEHTQSHARSSRTFMEHHSEQG